MKHAIALIALSLCAGTALAQPAAKTDVRSNDEPAELTRLPASRILLDTLEISGGRLVVSGVTPLPNRQVRLDQRYFAMSNDIGRFNFSLPYLPPDCIVELKIGALADQAVVANCGLQGERGIQGLAGRRGARGAAGSAGPQGVTGPAGPQGERGVPGPAGPQGSQGAPGAAGSGGGLKVVDANGQRVGVWYGSASVLVDINGGMFRVGVNRDGFRGADGCDGKCPLSAGLQVYHAAVDCSDQRMLPAPLSGAEFFRVPAAVSTGGILYYDGGPTQMITPRAIESISANSPESPGQCFVLGTPLGGGEPAPVSVVPIATLDLNTLGFVAPFRLQAQ